MSKIRLADAIENLRAELVLAMEQGQKGGVRFKVGPISLELEVEASEELGGNAGIKWWVVNVSAEMKDKAVATHKLKITLNPVDPLGADIKVRDVQNEVE